MTAHDANIWMRRQLPGAFRIFPHGTLFNPTRSELRRYLHHEGTPRGVKVHIYIWLRRRRRRP